MGRPRIAPDSHGIVNYCETSPGRFRARVRYRDRDGIVRYVAGFGKSKSAANTALQESLGPSGEGGEGVPHPPSVSVVGSRVSGRV